MIEYQDAKAALSLHQTIPIQYIHMKIKLSFTDPHTLLVKSLTDKTFFHIIYSSLKDFFGQVGGASYTVDILGYSSIDQLGIVRIPFKDQVPVRAAMALYGTHDGKRIAIHVVQESSTLLALFDSGAS
mmetsp:Transcript_5550/g.8204  ORF Transcript_5550/g.8204 Transcript_5550/m.8204 type:complete len:128 (-) Transcript_5550:551-934(-)